MRQLFFALLVQLLAWPALAQVNCGEQPKDVPPDVQQKLSGDVEGKAQLFTKLLGDVELKGKVDASKSEIYQKYKDIDKSQIDRYMIWVSCQTINADKTISTQDKIKLFLSIYKELEGNQSGLPGGETEYSLKQSRFGIVAGAVVGGWMLEITNASSEVATVNGVGFNFPADSIDLFDGLKIDHSQIKGFGFSAHVGNSDQTVTIQPRSSVRVPTYIYSCDPTIGYRNYQTLLKVFEAKKNGPVGVCSIRVFLSNLTEEAELTKNIDCASIFIRPGFTCPNI